MSLGACTGVGDPAVARPPADPPAPVAAAEPAPVAAEPVAPTPAPPSPPRLAVAFEGRCGDLGASVIDDQVLVHHVGPRGAINGVRQSDDHTTLIRLDAQGQPAEKMPSPSPYTADPHTGLSGLDALFGRWPDQVYAAISVGTRGDWDTGFIRYDGKAWSAVHPFGAEDRVNAVLRWHQRSIVAVACDGDCRTMKLPVIRGAPKGPRTDKLRAALAACEGLSLVDVAAIETGDLVAIGRCETGDAGLYAARWKPDDLAGDVERLAGPGFDVVQARVAHDGREAFWIALAGRRDEVLVRSAPGRWDEIEGPPGEAFADLAVDPRGGAWFLRPDGLFRREGEKWVAEDVEIGRMHELVGVEQDTPWVRGDAVARGVAGGPWHRVEVPPSAFFPDRRLEITGAEVDRAGDLWLDASFTVIRKDKHAVGRYYGAVVTSRPVARPLRCGEVLMEPMRAAFAPWPVGFDARCQKPLVLLLGQSRWKPGNTYPAYGKALRGATDVGAPRFVELEIGGELVLGAIVDDEPAANALIARARKAQRWKFPETVCGDEAALARADVKIVRELAVDLAAGKLHESP